MFVTVDSVKPIQDGLVYLGVPLGLKLDCRMSSVCPLIEDISILQRIKHWEAGNKK